jgi:hypothetical protein
MENEAKWYLPNEESLSPDGPFTQEEIKSKIEKGELSLDRFIWGTHFQETRWLRIYELPDFVLCLAKYPFCPIPKKHSRGLAHQTQKQFDFSQKKGEYGIENEYRRFPRAPFTSQVIVHNQKQLIRCSAVDISEKGLSIQTEDSTLFNVGEEIIITVLDSPYAGTFSMNATVMRSLDKPFRGYGLYFLTVNPNIKRKIAQFIIESLGFGIEERKTA